MTVFMPSDIIEKVGWLKLAIVFQATGAVTCASRSSMGERSQLAWHRSPWQHAGTSGIHTHRDQDLNGLKLLANWFHVETSDASYVVTWLLLSRIVLVLQKKTQKFPFEFPCQTRVDNGQPLHRHAFDQCSKFLGVFFLQCHL